MISATVPSNPKPSKYNTSVRRLGKLYSNPLNDKYVTISLNNISIHKPNQSAIELYEEFTNIVKAPIENDIIVNNEIKTNDTVVDVISVKKLIVDNKLETKQRRRTVMCEDEDEAKLNLVLNNKLNEATDTIEEMSINNNTTTTDNIDENNNIINTTKKEVVKFGPKARKRFILLKHSLPDYKFNTKLKLAIIEDCKTITDIECWSDEENNFFDLPDDDEENEDNDLTNNSNNDYKKLSNIQAKKIGHYAEAIHKTTKDPVTTSVEAHLTSLSKEDTQIIKDSVYILKKFKRSKLRQSQYLKTKGSNFGVLQKLNIITTTLLR